METLKVFRVKKDFEGGGLTEGEQQQEQKFKVKASELVISKSNVVEQKGAEAFVYCTRASPPHTSGYIPSSFLEHLSAEEANTFLRKSNLPQISEAKVLNMRKLVPYSDREATKRLLMHSGKQREEAPGLLPWKNGYSSYKKAHYNEALSQFKDKQIVFSSKISFNIAMTYKQMNQYESAVFYFTQAISQDPFFALALFLRGVCYWIGMKDPLQAIIDYSAADNVTLHFSFL
jgi:tetratricopeptide (TPR) repeat protein